ncbi:MAG TPA: hypothetical protein PKC15_07780 [Rhodocyclaceae bacterium]|uniref:hypothetical protein n=1 Tax=Plasticicumulans sp. TaxID=2307179 RepID=UPI002BA68F36|nr:hypothetical protein [Rhodocyclaceae bacterium]
MTSNPTWPPPAGPAHDQQVIATHIAGLSGKAIAGALRHTDETAASKIKSGQRGIYLHELAPLLALPSPTYPHGLQIASRDGIVVDASEVRALETLAGKYLEFRRRQEQPDGAPLPRDAAAD